MAGLGALLPGPARLLAPDLLAAAGVGPEVATRLGGLRGLAPQDLLPTRTIPVSGEAIPVVGFGSTKAVLEIPTEGTEPIANVIRMLLEFGGKLVDTSARPEEIDREFGQVLQDPEFVDRLFVTMKINVAGEQNGIDQFRQTQRLFGRPTLDLVQIESLRDLEVHWRNLRTWKDSGEARYIGVTVSNDFNHDRLEAFMRAESPDFVHMNYSVVETDAETVLLPLARDRGMAVLINRPFMNGEWFGMVEGRELPEWVAEFDCETWAQFSIKYVLSNPSVTCVLTETTDPEHMAENIRGGLGRLPDEATRRRMRELVLQF